MGVNALNVSRIAKACFPLDRTRIVKSCNSSWFQHIVERLITIENENLTEIASKFAAQEMFIVNSYKPLRSELKLAWIARLYNPDYDLMEIRDKQCFNSGKHAWLLDK